MSAKENWDDMIKEFRALGGIAENISLGSGPLGRGLFLLDAKNPAHILVPEALLFDADNLDIESGMLCVRDKSKIGAREIKFFEDYQNNFSWGAGGRLECEALVNIFDTIPEPITELLSAEFGRAKVFKRSGSDSVLERFSASRKIRLANGRAVLMPVLELVNHDIDGKVFKFGSGVSLKGVFAHEIFARYNVTDPFGAFFTWGFSNNASHAFSLPLSFSIGSRTLVVKRDLKEKQPSGKVRVPKVKRDGEKIILSHLMIGNAKNPRLVKGVFYRLMQEMDVSNKEEVFDHIQTSNSRQFVKLLLSLENFEGPSITALRKMALLQLEAISHCVGARTP